MSTNKVELAYEIIARDKNATRTFDKVGDASDRAGKAGAKFGKVMGGAVVAGAATAAAGIGVLAYKTAGWVKDAEESAKISRITAQAIESTGGAANISAEQIGKLAEKLSNKTAVDDEAIQSAQNMLLSFTNIRNEVGEGNDIFNQASAIALDYAERVGVDATQASVQLGKALNDPIKGVTALGKAGVQFTAQQKEQIKTMVEAGDTLGAQKLILAELTTQFGGSAEAAAGPLDRLRTIADNLGERVGTALLPYIEKLAVYLVDEGVPAFERMAAWVSANRVEIEGFARGAAVAFLEVTAGVFRVAEGFARGFALAIDAMNLTAQASFGMASNILKAFEASLGWLPGYGDTFLRARAMLDAFATAVDLKAGGASEDLRGFADTAGAAAQKVENLKDRIAEIQSKSVTVKLSIDSSALLRGAQTIAQLDRQAVGDGPGAGGPMVQRVSKMLANFPGLRVSSTYRSPARNRAVGGSPNSYHLNRANPAVDVVGPASQLDRLHAALRGAGGLRELLWRAPGHYDHLHVADKGGVYQGPGAVWMGAGQETFASGIHTAKKISDLPAAADSAGPVRLHPDDIRALAAAMLAGAAAVATGTVGDFADRHVLGSVV